MKLFMWQPDIVGWAHYIKDCLKVLGALYDASTSSSSALAAGCNLNIQPAMARMHRQLPSLPTGSLFLAALTITIMYRL